MNSRELAAFFTTAEKGSFLKAANALHVSAVSVMNQVNALENFVGAKLLERTPRGARLTAAGRLFRDDMQNVIALADAAVQKARGLANHDEYIIKVGTSILRPCKALIDLWQKIEQKTASKNLRFQLRIVPFDDAPSSLDTILSVQNKIADCFVSPCDSIEWRHKYNILQLDTLPCRVAVPRGHRLAGKKSLKWDDIDGENFMLIRRGDSPVLNQMRDEIMTKYSSINLIDIPNRYDTSIFNECERMNCLMETLDIWRDVHPSLLTLPMDWRYEMPYGIIYSKRPSEALKNFINKIAGIIIK